MLKEIEKKYLVDKIPENLHVLETKEIYQTYLAIGEEEVRLRKIVKDNQNQYTMTIKKGKGLTREEFEVEISEETYEQLLSPIRKKTLIKTRKIILLDGKKFDLDIYHNPSLAGLKTIEIEFNSEEEATSFMQPKWFGKDITEDKQFKNQTLWKKIQ